MVKGFELANGEKASEHNFFKVTSPRHLLMQPIANEERATRSGKLFSPEKIQVSNRNREMNETLATIDNLRFGPIHGQTTTQRPG